MSSFGHEFLVALFKIANQIYRVCKHGLNMGNTFHALYIREKNPVKTNNVIGMGMGTTIQTRWVWVWVWVCLFKMGMDAGIAQPTPNLPHAHPC